MAGVSYIIPNYNGKQLLADYLPSVIREAQVTNSEIIVVDDGSTDDSVVFIRTNYPQVRLFELKNNQGFAAACNYGVAQSNSELVCILNSDVEILAGFLQPLLPHFVDKDTFVVSSMQVAGGGKVCPCGLPAVEFKFGIFWYKYQILSGPPVKAVDILFAQGSASVYDKNKFLALGGFDTLYRPFYWEDMDLCYRAWKGGWKSIYEPASVHKHYGQATISRKHFPLSIMIFHWKNRFLFTWRNISSPLFLASHALFLPWEIFFLPFLGKPDFSLGFFYALTQLPEVVARKLKDRIKPKFDDAQIITRFSPDNVKKVPVAGPIAIAYLHETARIAGAENSLLNLIRNLDRKIFEPFFILPETGPLSDELEALGVPVIIIPFPKIRNVRGVGNAVKKLIELFRGKNIRIAHSNSIRTHIYAVVAANRCGIPSVWHQRNLLQRESIDPDRFLSFLADRIICNSAAIAARFETRGKLPDKVQVVFNGVDTGKFSPLISGSRFREELGIGCEEIVVGITSRFHQQKGHETFLRAAQMIVSGNLSVNGKVRFLIVGGSVFDEDKNREHVLRNMAEDLGLKDKVIFAGYRKDMPHVYAAMEIFVLSSKDEACGRVVLEAMSSGKPVVATNSGGNPEMIEDGICGFLIRHNDARILAEKIVFLANNPGFAHQMGQAARKRIEENFSIEKNVAQIQDAYLELLGKAEYE